MSRPTCFLHPLRTQTKPGYDTTISNDDAGGIEKTRFKRIIQLLNTTCSFWGFVFVKSTLYVFYPYRKCNPYKGRILPYKGGVFPYWNTCYFRILTIFWICWIQAFLSIFCWIKGVCRLPTDFELGVHWFLPTCLQLHSHVGFLVQLPSFFRS